MRIQDGEKDLFAELWGQVERLVVHIAARRLPPNGANNRIELGDLTQAGYLAMVNAVKDFDRESGTKFTTYLNLHLKNAFAGELGSKTTRRDALLQAISLNHRLGDGEGDDGAEMGDFLPDPDAENEFYVLDDRLTVQQDYEAVMKEVNKLDEKQRGIILKRFRDNRTLGEIGGVLGVSTEQVRQYERDALRKLCRRPALRVLAENYASSRTSAYRAKGLTAFKSSGTSTVEDLVEYREQLIREYLSALDPDETTDPEDLDEI